MAETNEVTTPKTHVCASCGHVQASPAPCEGCGHPEMEVLEGSPRAKATMPQARPL